MCYRSVFISCFLPLHPLFHSFTHPFLEYFPQPRWKTSADMRVMTLSDALLWFKALNCKYLNSDFSCPAETLLYHQRYSYCPCCGQALMCEYDPNCKLSSHLRIQSKACVKTCGAMQCSCWRIWHCSRVTDMAVRSFALLQLVTRTPFRRRQIWHKWGRYHHPGNVHSNY